MILIYFPSEVRVHLRWESEGQRAINITDREHHERANLQYKIINQSWILADLKQNTNRNYFHQL